MGCNDTVGQVVDYITNCKGSPSCQCIADTPSIPLACGGLVGDSNSQAAFLATWVKQYATLASVQSAACASISANIRQPVSDTIIYILVPCLSIVALTIIAGLGKAHKRRVEVRKQRWLKEERVRMELDGFHFDGNRERDSPPRAQRSHRAKRNVPRFPPKAMSPMKPIPPIAPIPPIRRDAQGAPYPGGTISIERSAEIAAAVSSAVMSATMASISNSIPAEAAKASYSQLNSTATRAIQSQLDFGALDENLIGAAVTASMTGVLEAILGWGNLELAETTGKLAGEEAKKQLRIYLLHLPRESTTRSFGSQGSSVTLDSHGLPFKNDHLRNLDPQFADMSSSSLHPGSSSASESGGLPMKRSHTENLNPEFSRKSELALNIAETSTSEETSAGNHDRAEFADAPPSYSV